ncbi:MAG: hypothetical protein ACI9G1_004245 [Pirellulaceae bacterium]|jgi:hypothetical protein
MAVAILSIMMLGLAGLTSAVQMSHDHTHSRHLAMQNARVVLNRMQRTVVNCQTSDEFPGAIVVLRNGGPDRLVVWSPETTASDPEGRPLVNELIVFCPHPTSKNRLMEIRDADDTSQAPVYGSTAAWRDVIDDIQDNADLDGIELTDLLDTVTISGITYGWIRFSAILQPTDTNLSDLGAGSITWEEVPWVQGIYSDSVGLRQVRCPIEMQLNTGDEKIPFFWSAARYFDVNK